ncbi:hypothetical protein MTO96_004083 [Rhipicephalus appendiculatus]
MLWHYENECTFHSVECLRCGEGVLHRELATHYVAGCSPGVPQTCKKNASAESKVVTLQYVSCALEELKMLMRDATHDQMLPAIQTQVNELIEEVRNQQSKSDEITHGARASVDAERSQEATADSLDVLEDTPFRRNASGRSQRVVFVAVMVAANDKSKA